MPARRATARGRIEGKRFTSVRIVTSERAICTWRSKRDPAVRSKAPRLTCKVGQLEKQYVGTGPVGKSCVAWPNFPPSRLVLYAFDSQSRGSLKGLPNDYQDYQQHTCLPWHTPSPRSRRTPCRLPSLLTRPARATLRRVQHARPPPR